MLQPAPIRAASVSKGFAFIVFSFHLTQLRGVIRPAVIDLLHRERSGAAQDRKWHDEKAELPGLTNP
jgi:hypothetical protein